MEGSSGRLSFMGVDMAFLIVNGIEMFTLHEILKKIFPNTPRTTVCTRLEKMKAIRHACSKEEIRILKGLGGVRPNAINCAMIARKDIVVYCEKFTEENNVEDTLSPCLNTIQTAFLKEANNFDSIKDKDKDKIDQTRYKSDDNTCNADKHISLFVDSKPNVPRVESVINNSPNLLTVTVEVLSTRDPVNSRVDDDDAPDSKLSQIKRTMREAVVPTSEVDSHKQDSPSTCNKKPIKKRKRRTNLEILESYNGEISCGIIYNKRQRKVCNFENGTWVRPKTKLAVDRVDLSASTQNSNDDGKILNVVVGDGVGDKEGNLGFQLDDNNNNVQPHSPPKFLLKRSLNNEWRIASSGVGCPSLHQTPTSPENINVFTTNSTAYHQGTVNNTKPKESKKLLLASKKKKPRNKVGLTTSTKVKKKRGSAGEMIKTEGQETKTIEVEVKSPDTAKETMSMVDFPPDGTDIIENETTPTKSNLFTLDKDFKMMPRLRTPMKELSTIGVEKTKLSKPALASEDANKPKRRRRAQLHAFRLVETIPYSALLMVKDGDLCPAYTMIYSSNKSDPGCCHPLWRWRLGKPVSPAKQPRISSSPVKQPQSEICDESLEHQDQAVVSTKDNIHIDCPSIVNVIEYKDDNNS